MSEHLVKRACETSDCCVFHIGFRESEMRILLGGVDADHPTHVVELHGVHSFFDRGIVSREPVLVTVQQGAGSFGWELSAEQRQRYQEVFLRMKADEFKNPFRAIVGQVVQREVESSDEHNWPG